MSAAAMAAEAEQRRGAGPTDQAASTEQNNNHNHNGSLAERQLKKRSSVQSNHSMSSSDSLAAGRRQFASMNNDDSGAADEGDENEDGAGGTSRMSNAEYDHLRNKAVLFFFDRLYLASREGKEARTLHELSCLFGTKEFTKDMRQIVGASRNGLRNFLEAYPSLFHLEGDKVFLSHSKEGSLTSQRDYNKEAVDYFKQKLLQFGTSLVPIKNLFGYRSQASQEVRHVSGKSARDFKRFLKQNEAVFEMVADEHVVLKSALQELKLQGLTTASLEKSVQQANADDSIIMDPYLNKQFAHLIEDCIKRLMLNEEVNGNGEQGESNKSKCSDKDGGAQTKEASDDESKLSKFKVSLEELLKHIKSQCQNELFLKMVKTIEDLRMFLRMHPNLFKRVTVCSEQNEQNHSDKSCKPESDGADKDKGSQEFVCLVSESERNKLNALAYPAHASANLANQSPTVNQMQTNPKSAAPLEVQSRRDSSATTAQIADYQPQPFSSLPPTTLSTRINATSSSTTAREQAQQNDQQQSAARAGKREQVTANRRNSHHDVPNDHQSGKLPRVAPTTPTSKQFSAASSITSLSSNSHQLRANAPPFIPLSRSHCPGPSSTTQPHSISPSTSLNYTPSQHTIGIHKQNSSLAHNYRTDGVESRASSMQMSPIQRSVSNLNYQQQQNRTLEQVSASGRSALRPLDGRTAIRKYLLEGNTNAKHQSFAGGGYQPTQPKGDHQYEAAVGQGVDLRARTIDVVREASNIITRIMTTTDAVAFDCKGFNLGFDGQITLIQFGFLPTKQVDPMQLANAMNKKYSHISSSTTASLTNNNELANGVDDKSEVKPKPEVCVFDLITNPELAYCLKPILESDKIVKIVHDVRNKSNALYVQFKIILNNVFDTQVANLVIQQQDTGKPAYKSRYISMSKLCEIYGGEDLVNYRNMIKFKTSSRTTGQSGRGSLSTSSSTPKDFNYWRTRPLTRAMVYEATMDVYCLVGGVYQNLKSRIKPEYEPLFNLLNFEGVLARIKPQEIRSAKKERKIDLELIDLKRKLYSENTGPVVLSNREIRLLRHIDLTEEVRNKIQQCKKVAKKLERLDMKAALLKQEQELEGANDGQQPPTLLNSQFCSIATDDGEEGDEDEDGENSKSDSLIMIMSNKNELSTVEELIRAKLDEFNATGMMMDSSVFDELKDKMIESSSLLESLEDEEDEEARLSSGHHSHNGSSINDCCRCQCHHNHKNDSPTTARQHQNVSDSGKQQQVDIASQSYKIERASEHSTTITTSETGTGISAKTLDSSPGTIADEGEREKSDLNSSDNNKLNYIKRESAQMKKDNDGDEAQLSSDDSKLSACDMAVQCDLLS